MTPGNLESVFRMQIPRSNEPLVPPLIKYGPHPCTHTQPSVNGLPDSNPNTSVAHIIKKQKQTQYLFHAPFSSSGYADARDSLKAISPECV